MLESQVYDLFNRYVLTPVRVDATTLLATGSMLSAELAERDFHAAFQGGRTFYGFDGCAITRF
jgi:hypothetical protein